jgi:hypothetical protein
MIVAAVAVNRSHGSGGKGLVVRFVAAAATMGCRRSYIDVGG